MAAFQRIQCSCALDPSHSHIHNGGFKKDMPDLQDVVVMEGVAHFINQEKPKEISKSFNFYPRGGESH
jgi:hypothetical protein